MGKWRAFPGLKGETLGTPGGGEVAFPRSGNPPDCELQAKSRCCDVRLRP
jgi:hypothetical protein